MPTAKGAASADFPLPLKSSCSPQLNEAFGLKRGSAGASSTSSSRQELRSITSAASLGPEQPGPEQLTVVISLREMFLHAEREDYGGKDYGGDAPSGTIGKDCQSRQPKCADVVPVAAERRQPHTSSGTIPGGMIVRANHQVRPDFLIS